jgi:hypothetical protein
MMLRRLFTLSLTLLFLLSTPALPAQQSSRQAQPSYAQDEGFGQLDISPLTDITAEQIIQRFAAKETQFKHARDQYTYRQTVKIQTITDEGKVDGEMAQVSDITFDPNGRRQEHVVFAPVNSLERVQLTPADMSDIENRLPFVLTSEDIGQYNLTYKGRQKVDDLDTYVFDVAPKVLEKNKRYFQGRIWVDQKDLQIVLTSGKNVPDDTRKGHEDLSPPFTTYREQIDGRYWFPTYTKADATLHFKGSGYSLAQDVHIRQILRYTNYKQFGTSVKIIYDGQDITNKSTPEKPGQAQPDTQTPSAQAPASTQTAPH